MSFWKNITVLIIVSLLPLLSFYFGMVTQYNFSTFDILEINWDMIAAIGSILAAIAMFCTIKKMSKQNVISADSVKEMKKQHEKKELTEYIITIIHPEYHNIETKHIKLLHLIKTYQDSNVTFESQYRFDYSNILLQYHYKNRFLALIIKSVLDNNSHHHPNGEIVYKLYKCFEDITFHIEIDSPYCELSSIDHAENLRKLLSAHIHILQLLIFILANQQKLDINIADKALQNANDVVEKSTKFFKEQSSNNL